MRKFNINLLVNLMFLGLIIISLSQLQVLRDQGTGNPVMANPYPEMKGSPYWSEFEIGKIIYSEKDTVSNLVIAFNAFNHTLVYSVD
jgi:hypothetical protein